MNLVRAVQLAKQSGKPFRAVAWRELDIWCEVIVERGEIVYPNGSPFIPSLRDVLGEWETVTFSQLKNEELQRRGL